MRVRRKTGAIAKKDADATRRGLPRQFAGDNIVGGDDKGVAALISPDKVHHTGKRNGILAFEGLCLVIEIGGDRDGRQQQQDA